MVQALPHRLRFDERPAMYFRRYSNQQLPRRWPFWRDSLLLAVHEIVFDCRNKFSTQLCDGSSVEADDAAKAKNPPLKKDGGIFRPHLARSAVQAG
jgi:hypothetical protein